MQTSLQPGDGPGSSGWKEVQQIPLSVQSLGMGFWGMVSTPWVMIFCLSRRPGGNLEPRFLWARLIIRRTFSSHSAGGSLLSEKLMKVLGVLPRSAQTHAQHCLAHSFRGFVYSQTPIHGSLDQYIDVNSGSFSVVAVEQWAKPICPGEKGAQ